jgi:hypothetical protein
VTDDQVLQWLAALEVSLVGVPENKQWPLIKAAFAQLPPDKQVFATAMYERGRKSGIALPRRPEKQRLVMNEKRLGIVLGGGLVLLLFVTAIFFPRPTHFQGFVFRVILALGAGGLGALAFGGMFKIEGKTKGFGIRATGALGVFVLVYLLNPPAAFEDKDDAQANPAVAQVHAAKDPHSFGEATPAATASSVDAGAKPPVR